MFSGMKFTVFNKLFVLNNKFRVVMIILIIFVWLFVINSYTKFLFEPKYYYFIVLTILFVSIFLFFTTRRLFFLFVLFESRLLAILAIIICWGYQIERVAARTYLLFYTMVASLPLILVFVFISNGGYSRLIPCVVV
jgi:NADH:ubiquinone oxidoreductase subunit 4 (subunit M)